MVNPKNIFRSSTDKFKVQLLAFTERMSPGVSQILHNHLQLCKWQDELEFLCFVLCAIFEGPKDRNCECNQTLDLLQFVKKINTLCEDSHGRLRQLVPEHELSQLKSCHYQIKQIRNLAAHHVPAGNGVMKEKQAVFDSVIAKLESTIQKGAKTYQVHQVRTFSRHHNNDTKIQLD